MGKEANAIRVIDTILMPSFWNTVAYILKFMGPLVWVLHLANNVGPLVWVLHLANNERKLVMGNTMDRTNYYESFQWEWRQNWGQQVTIMSKQSISVQTCLLVCVQ